ncbi:reverse transcriptase domain-containing protein [Tanacetum coccineum]
MMPDFDPEGDRLLLKKLLNDDPSSLLPPKKLHFEEIKTIKSSIDDPPELELKDLPSHFEYAFLEGTDKLPGIDPSFCTHKILMEDDFKPAIQHQRRVNPKIHEVIKKEVIKLLDAGLIYPISDSPWVSPVHCVPKKGGMTVVENEDNELIPTRLVTGWRVCIDYHKLNDATRKDHFPLPFMDQMLERLAGNEYYCFLDGFSGYFQIPIDPKDQDKAPSLALMGRLPTDVCLLVYVMLWARSKGHKISKSGIEVDKAKVDVIAKLPHPTSVKGVRSFLGHVGFYRRFIQDFSKIARPMTHLLEKETLFIFSKECIKAFNILKKKLTEAPILVAPDWDLPFEIMCDAGDYAVRCSLGGATGCSRAREALISSRLAIMDPPGDIMVPTTPLRKSLIPVSIGLLFTEMPMTWSHGVTLVNVKEKSANRKNAQNENSPVMEIFDVWGIDFI